MLRENTNKNTKTSTLDKNYKEDLSYACFSLCHYVAAKVACDSLRQYLHRHSSCDLAITHSGDPLSFSICQLSAWDSRENYRRFLENYKGQQKGRFDLFLFSLFKGVQVPAVCQLTDFILPRCLSPFFCSFPENCFSFSHVSPFHTLPLPVIPFACLNPLHKNGRATKNPLPSNVETGYYLDISMNINHYLP